MALKPFNQAKAITDALVTERDNLTISTREGLLSKLTFGHYRCCFVNPVGPSNHHATPVSVLPRASHCAGSGRRLRLHGCTSCGHYIGHRGQDLSHHHWDGFHWLWDAAHNSWDLLVLPGATSDL